MTLQVRPDILKLMYKDMGLGEERYAESADLTSSLFGIPYNIVVGSSNQLFFESGMAWNVKRLAEKQLETSGIKSQPQVVILGNKPTELVYTTWAIGSPHRNPLTRFLVSDGKNWHYGLDPALKLDLPYRFNVSDVSLASRGYAAYSANPGEPFHGIEDDINSMSESPEDRRLLKRGYVNARRKRKEPATAITDPHGGILVPEYYSGPGYLDRFLRDYWMITRMPLPNPKSERYGQTCVVFSGCHDLGTLHAYMTMFDTGRLRELKKKLAGQPAFQIVGCGEKSGDSDIIDVVVI